MPCFQQPVNLIMEIWSLHLENTFGELFSPFYLFGQAHLKLAHLYSHRNGKQNSLYCTKLKNAESYSHQLLQNCICVVSKEVFRLMSDGSQGRLLHFLYYGIRRVCGVAFGPETKKLVAWYQEKGEKTTRRRKRLEPSHGQPQNTIWTVKSPGAAGP